MRVEEDLLSVPTGRANIPHIVFAAVCLSVLLIFVLAGFVQGADTVSPTAAHYSRETLFLNVLGTSATVDSQVFAAISRKLAPRFDISKKQGTYRLDVIGRCERVVYDTLLNLTPIAVIGPAYDSIYYTVALTLPNGKVKRYGSDILASEPGIFTISVGSLWLWLNRQLPHTGRVVGVQPDGVAIDIGRLSDVRLEDYFEVFDESGKHTGAIEVVALSDTTATARRLDRHDIKVGYSIRQRPRLLRWSMIFDYAYLAIPAGDATRSGKQFMLGVGWHPSYLRPFHLRIQSGYLDVANETGWHVLQIEARIVQPAANRLLDLELGGGVGAAMMRITEEKDAAGNEIKAKGIATYNLYSGVAFNISRAYAVSIGVGYVGYSRYERPDRPTLHVGFRMRAH